MPLNRVGQQYGPWLVVSYSDVKRVSGKLDHAWLCRCFNCLGEQEIRAKRLYHPPVCSCGINKKKRNGRHNMCGTPTYSSWAAMIGRCHQINSGCYERYGGKGVTVCDSWRDFGNFYRDMGKRPSTGYSIDRIDGNKGYSKQNCRWATSEQQANNRKTNRFITFNGERKTLSQWARYTGLNKEAIRYRLDTGWPIEKALTKPSIRGGKHHD